MSRALALVALIGSLLAAAPGDSREGDGRRITQAAQPREFFIGAWQADVAEFGQQLRIFWTLWENGRLAYHFQDGADVPPVRGATGAWRVEAEVMHEAWERPDGTSGAGRGRVERIDDDTIRLTIIDNGDPAYTGFVRVYRRIGVPQLSMR